MNINRKNYLRRIGIDKKDVTADLDSLKFLQRQHLLTIPFENLDIHWKRSIVLDGNLFYNKIIGEKRGGFCYELNGLFCELLREIGFQNKIISARISKGNGDFGAEYDHLAIITQIENEEYLVDVGFGSFTAESLKFVLDVEQEDDNGVFLIRKHAENYFEVVKKDGEEWRSEYIFTTLNRDLAEFAGMCQFHQTSPESHFTRGKICSLMTLEGRKTLTDGKFIETKNGQKKEIPFNSDEEFNRILESEFYIKPNFNG
jgi:N-hydroxyarylamine O-acetyltransferase